jgi:hypothetical protein
MSEVHAELSMPQFCRAGKAGQIGEADSIQIVGVTLIGWKQAVRAHIGGLSICETVPSDTLTAV